MWDWIKNQYLGLFLSGLSQVTFVAMNVYLVAHKQYIPAFITGFMISIIWTFNVKKVAFGGWAMRCSYAGGAACGTMLGMLLMTILYK